MKVLLDIKDNKAAHLLAILKDLPYVKANTLTPYKAKILEDIKEAVEQMNLVQTGKLKGKDANELINEL